MNNKPDHVMDLILDQLQKMDAKVDKIDDRLTSVDKTLIKQEMNLAEHMRRTDLLESDLKPVKRHVVMLEGGLKLMGVVSLVIGLLVGLGRLLG